MKKARVGECGRFLRQVLAAGVAGSIWLSACGRAPLAATGRPPSPRESTSWPTPPAASVGNLADQTPSPPAGQPTPVLTSPGPMVQWHQVAPGMDRAEAFLPVPRAGLVERLVLFRLDPADFELRVLYAPGAPAQVAGWEPGARLVINAGFFDEHNAATGLLVSDGQAWGQSYVGFGGMVAVDALGEVRVRSLAAEPWQRGEVLAQAAQGFPVLVRPDGTLYAETDEARARRTAIGQDRQGRLLVIVAPAGALTLGELAGWLAGAGLDLIIALNLDGGGSTGYTAGPGDQIDSLTAVPAVIAFYPRSAP